MTQFILTPPAKVDPSGATAQARGQPGKPEHYKVKDDRVARTEAVRLLANPIGRSGIQLAS
jgi:hypothetical protein